MICWWENKHTIICFSNVHYLVAAVFLALMLTPNLWEKTLSEARWVTLYILCSVWVSNMKTMWVANTADWSSIQSGIDFSFSISSIPPCFFFIPCSLLSCTEIRTERKILTPIIKQLMRFCTSELPWISYNSNILTLVWHSKRERLFYYCGLFSTLSQVTQNIKQHKKLSYHIIWIINA